MDTSKYFNRLLEVSVAERGVETGIVLDELNAQLRRTTCGSRPTSTASRATIGGAVANNSAARARSHGKTIDHVLEQQVVLSDGSVIDCRPLSREEVAAVCARDTLGRAATEK